MTQYDDYDDDDDDSHEWMCPPAGFKDMTNPKNHECYGCIYDSHYENIKCKSCSRSRVLEDNYKKG